jgi:hypothetical protein
MSVYTHDCPPDDCGPCGTLPSGFVRLRYFYGKRLGVVDFLDEQRYHAGKLRFHNQRLHGVGVLCGLGAAIFESTTTVLRIGKGAALDACGREIVVGYDQCVDVAAWYARYRAAELAEDPAWTPELDGDVLRLCVALRFRECPSGIEPAPRDPCACDATGNDYGRVREEFELELLLHADAEGHTAPPIAPPRPVLDTALARAVGGGDLVARLRELLHAGCAEADHDGWLVLACFGARLSADRTRVEALVDVASTASMLYSSALLEDLLVRALGATAEAGAWATGAPEITGIQLDPANPDRVLFSLSGPILNDTLPDPDACAVRELTTEWQPPVAATSLVFTDAPPVITAEFPASTFGVDRKFRLWLAADAPPVDDAMRPLHPLRPSFHFRVVDASGTLTIGPAPFAEASP